MVRNPVVAHPDEVLRPVAARMAEHQLGALPVVAREDPRLLVGLVTEFELLDGRRRQLEEERKRERTLMLPLRRALLRTARTG
jgi:CBS domain-containing protein